MKIYPRKKTGGDSVPTNVVINLSNDLLNTGRAIVANKFYTNLEFSNILLDNKIHYVGILR